MKTALDWCIKPEQFVQRMTEERQTNIMAYTQSWYKTVING